MANENIAAQYGVLPPYEFQRRPVSLPPVTKPLRYCEFRPEPGSTCNTFACAQLEEMWFCVQHHATIEHALRTENQEHDGTWKAKGED